MVLEDEGHDQQRRGQEAAHRAPQPGPEGERHEHRERVQLEPAADDGRRDKMAFNKGNADKGQRRDQAGAEGGGHHHPDPGQNHEHRDRTDDGKEVQGRGQRPEACGIGHAGGRADDAGRGADAEIDHRHRKKVAAELRLDGVENPQGSQPLIMTAKGQDQRAPQVPPACDEQNQRRNKQQEFSEGRRQEFQRRLDPVEFRHLERRRVECAGSANHALELLPQREQRVEHMQLVAQHRSQLRQARGPLHQRGGDQADHEGDAGARRRHDQHGRNGARDPMPFQQSRGRRQHGADHERRRHREKKGFGDVEHGDDTDRQQRDQGKGDDLRALDHRRQFILAFGFWRTCRLLGKGTFIQEGHATSSPLHCGCGECDGTARDRRSRPGFGGANSRSQHRFRSRKREMHVT